MRIMAIGFLAISKKSNLANISKFHKYKKANDYQHAILKKSIKKIQFNGWKFISFHNLLKVLQGPLVENHRLIEFVAIQNIEKSDLMNENVNYSGQKTKSLSGPSVENPLFKNLYNRFFQKTFKLDVKLAEYI